MIVNLVCNETLNTIILPKRVSGQFEFPHENRRNAVLIEGLNGEWVLKAPFIYAIRSMESGIDPSAQNAVPLEERVLYILKFDPESDDSYYVFTEEDTTDRIRFSLFSIPEQFDLTVGGGKLSKILVYENDFVSSSHAVLSYRNGQWSLTDTDSRNGTFVNGKKQRQCSLKFGDMVFIMGLKIIVGKQCFAINCPDGKAHIHSSAVSRVKFPRFVPQDDETQEESVPEYFDRSPRFKRDIVPAEITVDSPPNANQGEEMPLILTVGPAMTMAMASMTTGMFAVTNAIANNNIKSAVPTIVMSASMCLGTLLWPTLTRKYQRKLRIRKETQRQKKYCEYLVSKQKDIQDICDEQEMILHENNITIEECEKRIMEVHRNLWERSMGQNDFLNLRIGIGDLPMVGKLNYNSRRFSLNDDELESKMLDMCEQPKTLYNVPVALSLMDQSVGVIGPKKTIYDFVKGLIIQLAALYSYDEVKLIFLYDEADAEYFSFVKWLPHVWNQDKNFRFIAADAAATKDVSAYLERIVSMRESMTEQDLENEQPYYLVVAMSKHHFNRIPCLRDMLASKKKLHMSLLAVFQEFRELPKECAQVVELKQDFSGKIYDKNDISGNAVAIKADFHLSYSALELSTQLANIALDDSDESASLPKMITFLQLMQVGKVEHLNAMVRWKENDPTKSLAAAVGVNAFGDQFVLDLHEKAHGPHGLVAGMTGSGKSEFIITYILSLAVNYHPDEVSFILIDYKGGGMAKSFENLPHTAGIITNLDGSAIKRSLVSINSELKRRQTLLAQASKIIGESNINIYQYQKLFREGLVIEPLSHLFIIADEFAELKTQQSEFMTELISAARIGRSLGVHLILATQKPSGVVDDQIWSNSRFRVCLKVQEKQDSMDMLKRPDAAELAETGRFFLQVGYNELFELGQSAWAGADYIPADKAVFEKDNGVEAIDLTGHVIRSAKPNRLKKESAGNAKKQLDIITQYLSRIAAEENIHAKALWLDPLPEMITLPKLEERYAEEFRQTAEPFCLNPVIGEYDNPARQSQGLLTLPISAEGNVIIYGAAGAGKTLLVNTILYSLMTQHTAREVNFYLLDFADETLSAFSEAPHVGDVMMSGDGEKIARMFKMLYQHIKRRKKRLSALGTDYQTYVRQHPDADDMPAMVILIHNFAAFSELYADQEDDVIYLSREGIRYGLFFILTATASNGIRYRITQNFKQYLMLQMNDESDYSSVLGKTEGLFPAKLMGRGLCKRDIILEFQTAHISEDETVFDSVKAKCAELKQNWTGVCAEPIPILPEVVDLAFLMPHYHEDTLWNVPVGVNKNTLRIQYFDFSTRCVDLIASANSSCWQFANELTALLLTNRGWQVRIFDPQSRLTVNPALYEAGTALKLFRTAEECCTGARELFSMVLQRNNTYKDAVSAQQEPPEFDPVIWVAADMSALLDLLNEANTAAHPDDTSERFKLAMEKNQKAFRCHVLIADTAKSISKYSYNSWFKDQISAGDGIWVGNGASEQYYLKTNDSVPSMRTAIAEPLGYVYADGEAVLCKLLMESDGESDEHEVSG